MLEKPQITRSTAQLTAVIPLTIPREAIRHVMGPGLAELRSAIAAQGIAPAGPWFSHHLRMDPAVFDFEISIPVAAPIVAVGRVRPSHLPAVMVARTVFRGPYEELGDAWGEFISWTKANGHTPGESLWECYLTGTEPNADPATPCTELNLPLIS
ncbi:MAG: transcriptional regulator, effector-binding domain/component [Herminiimonas sp.]|nr:transcriptional regulator, effector-binding domain/component [Herminiimonas sp.]